MKYRAHFWSGNGFPLDSLRISFTKPLRKVKEIRSRTKNELDEEEKNKNSRKKQQNFIERHQKSSPEFAKSLKNLIRESFQQKNDSGAYFLRFLSIFGPFGGAWGVPWTTVLYPGLSVIWLVHWHDFQFPMPLQWSPLKMILKISNNWILEICWKHQGN